MYQAFIGPAELLGRRVGELHVALASSTSNPAFRPEPFTPHYQRSVYQRMRTEAIHTMQLLRKRLRDLPESTRDDVDALIAAEPEIQQRFRSVIEHKIGGKRIRLHGDLHLGNIVLIEGRPTLFDAIEFDPLIASGDLLYDLAFLLMDLVERGLAEGAEAQ